MSRYLPYNLRQQGTSIGSCSRGQANPYFLLFATDADRELKIPIHEAASYRTLREGQPARLRKCKVMVRMFDHVHWFLVTTRYSNVSATNRPVRETMGFSWNGPLMVTRLERRGARAPAGIISTEHHQAAIAAVERYLDLMSAELGRPDRERWRAFIADD